MLKSKLLIAALAGALIFPVVSCKKGENDPGSLSSRTKRLSGTWNMTEWYDTTWVYNDGTGVTDHYVTAFSGTTLITEDSAVTAGGTTVWSNYNTETYSRVVEFDKDGNFTRTDVTDGYTQKWIGYWAWAGKSDAGGLEKKEQIVYTVTAFVNGPDTDSSASTYQSVSGSWTLDRLAKDEMWVIANTYETQADFDTIVSNSTMKFTK